VTSLDLREAGDAALLLQLGPSIDPEVNARAVTVATSVRNRSLAGVRDVVSTFRSVAVHFDPIHSDAAAIAAALREASATPGATVHGKAHEIPVAYGGEDGPDLEEIAGYARITAKAVAERHAGVCYRVYMLGFQPGFAYLGQVDPTIATPRRATPRVRVPAGAVGIAGRQTGVYPDAAPGGWQIIGRALVPVIDPVTYAPRFAPGDSVTFVAARPPARPPRDSEAAGSLRESSGAAMDASDRRVTVVSPGLFTTIQDAGQWGRQHDGFPVSGAMDVVSHRIANRLVGNRDDAGAVEVTISGPELRFEQRTVMAVTGADLSPTIDGHAIPPGAAIDARSGAVLRFGGRRSGTRAYVAFAGGVRVGRRWPAAPVAAGQVLVLNPGGAGEASPRGPTPAMPRGGARLRVLKGPQEDHLPPHTFDALLRHRFRISPQSNRIGYRLSGAAVPSSGGEMISDATFAGGIQIPPSGQPILLMADRQTTGGYPQVATVISADLPTAGQLAPGDWVEFVPVTRNEAILAMLALENSL
jgi:KipI family sensor histidine kinase inhibitor